MRRVTLLIIHCSAVRPGQRSSAQDIDGWHRAKGWKMIGYHYVVRRDGTVENGRSVEAVGAHCTGHNQHSVGIVYEGGLDEDGRPADTRTPAQKQALRRLLEKLKRDYPQALVVGHNVFSPKPCPCFDAVAEYADL